MSACAHGWFMEAVTARGITCVGIEPDLEMERRARSAGHNVIAGLFQTPCQTERGLTQSRSTMF